MELQLLFVHQQLSNCQAHFCLHKRSLSQKCFHHKCCPFNLVPQTSRGHAPRLPGLPPSPLLPGMGLTHPGGAEVLGSKRRQPAPAVLR